MKAFGTYLQNDAECPLVYGEVELINPPRQRLRGGAAEGRDSGSSGDRRFLWYGL